MAMIPSRLRAGDPSASSANITSGRPATLLEGRHGTAAAGRFGRSFIAAGLCRWRRRHRSIRPGRSRCTLVCRSPPAAASIRWRGLIGGKLEAAAWQERRDRKQAGAGSIIAATYVQKASPRRPHAADGTAPDHGVNVLALQKPAVRDPTTDFNLIGLLSGTPFVLMVNVDLPVKSVPDLLALCQGQSREDDICVGRSPSCRIICSWSCS